MDSVIEIKDLRFAYPGYEETIKGVSLNIERGSFVAVLGHNGSGKSTFAKLLNAILLPTAGTIKVNGTDTADEERLLDIRRTVGMVFQNPDNLGLSSADLHCLARKRSCDNVEIAVLCLDYGILFIGILCEDIFFYDLLYLIVAVINDILVLVVVVVALR